MDVPVLRRGVLRLLRPVGHSFAHRAKWMCQCCAAECFAFFARPGMASPSAQNGCASAAPQNASPSSPGRAWLRPPRPYAALPSSISGASRRCAIYSNRRSAPSSVSRRIEKYPPPRKFWGLGSRPNPCHPSVRGPVPAALSISFRLQKAYNTDAAMVAKSPLRDGLKVAGRPGFFPMRLRRLTA